MLNNQLIFTNNNYTPAKKLCGGENLTFYLEKSVAVADDAAHLVEGLAGALAGFLLAAVEDAL